MSRIIYCECGEFIPISVQELQSSKTKKCIACSIADGIKAMEGIHKLAQCECDAKDRRQCKIHVQCDADCKAMLEPKTLEEYAAALEHWISHDCDRGCSHGC